MCVAYGFGWENKISITFKRNYYQNLLLTFEDSTTVYPIQGN